MLGHRGQQRPVHAAGLARRGHRREHVARERRGVLQQRPLTGVQVGVERVAHGSGRTATAISSTFASASNSRVTPNSPIAG